MTISFLSLPAEIIEAIARVLDSPVDLFSLRQTCKLLSQKTLHYFCQTYITTFETDLSSMSLQTLQSISESEQLRHRVQTLLIKGNNNGHELGAGFQWLRNPVGYVETSLSSGVQMLRDIILKGLPNCRSFHIKSPGGTEDFSASEFIRPSDAVGIVLAIVAETAMPVQSFFLDFKEHGSGSVDSKRLQMQLYQQETFRTAWTHMQELRLEFWLKDDTFDWARDLVLQTTSLTKLSLVYSSDCLTSFLDSLISSPHIFQTLQEFKLGTTNVTTQTLCTLLTPSRYTLRAIFFRHVFLRDGGTWVSILEDLAKNFPLLSKIAVLWLREYDSRNEKRIHVDFPTLEDNPEVVPGRKFSLSYKKWGGKKRVWGVSYESRVGMKRALEIMAKSASNTEGR